MRLSGLRTVSFESGPLPVYRAKPAGFSESPEGYVASRKRQTVLLFGSTVRRCYAGESRAARSAGYQNADSSESEKADESSAISALAGETFAHRHRHYRQKGYARDSREIGKRNRIASRTARGSCYFLSSDFCLRSYHERQISQ